MRPANRESARARPHILRQRALRPRQIGRRRRPPLAHLSPLPARLEISASHSRAADQPRKPVEPPEPAAGKQPGVEDRTEIEVSVESTGSVAAMRQNIAQRTGAEQEQGVGSFGGEAGNRLGETKIFRPGVRPDRKGGCHSKRQPLRIGLTVTDEEHLPTVAECRDQIAADPRIVRVSPQVRPGELRLGQPADESELRQLLPSPAARTTDADEVPGGVEMERIDQGLPCLTVGSVGGVKAKLAIPLLRVVE